MVYNKRGRWYSDQVVKAICLVEDEFRNDALIKIKFFRFMPDDRSNLII